MGKRERMRRRQERRDRGPAPGGRREGREFPARELIIAAAKAWTAGDPRHAELVSSLAAGPPSVAAEVDRMLAEAHRLARARNWEPADLRHQARRQLGDAHAEYVDDVVAGAAGPALVERWAARDGLGHFDALAGAIAVLALLGSLPPLPRLGPPERAAPRPKGTVQNARMLEKVRALLAKAESTTFPEEAESLSAKAQELMARHAIDEAMVGAAGGGPASQVPSGVRLPVDDPYARPKSVLLSVVASANRCKAVWCKDLGFSAVLGFEADLEFVEILYTSLLVQATSAMVAAGSQVDRYGRSRTRSFRQAFLLAYATRIGQRLRAAEASSRAAAAEDYGAALLPVLASREAAVDAAIGAAFPRLVTTSVSVSNAAGWAAGSAAAELASLSGRTEVPA